MNVVKVKNVVIGEGKPKICVPIVAKTKRDIIEQAKKIKMFPVDIVEWRADWFEEVNDTNRVLAVLKQLVDVLYEVPLLFTIRTLKEGGQINIEETEYISLNIEVAKSGLADLIDVEVYGVCDVIGLVNTLQNYDVKVVASSHDFEKTPSKDDMLETLKYMQSIKADILKIAVMPNSKGDVLELLSATLIMKEKYADRPMITISMGEYGMVTRLVGEMFGSDVTFGSVGTGSAPGQILVEDLSSIINILHKDCAIQ